MLSNHEKRLVIRWLREYPPRIDPDQWGYGPLKDADPNLKSEKICMQYG